MGCLKGLDSATQDTFMLPDASEICDVRTGHVAALLSYSRSELSPPPHTHTHHVEDALVLVGDVHLVIIRTAGGDGGFGPQGLTTTQMNHCSFHACSKLRV